MKPHRTHDAPAPSCCTGLDGALWQMFEGTVESAKEHKPPRAMPQLMQYFKAIKVTTITQTLSGRARNLVVCCFFLRERTLKDLETSSQLMGNHETNMSCQWLCFRPLRSTTQTTAPKT